MDLFGAHSFDLKNEDAEGIKKGTGFNCGIDNYVHIILNGVRHSDRIALMNMSAEADEIHVEDRRDLAFMDNPLSAQIQR